MRNWLWMLMIFITTLLIADGAYACSCDSLVSPEEKVRNAAIVFIGTVISVEEYKPMDPIIDKPYINQRILRIGFDVKQRLKGPAPQRFIFVTNAAQSACGENFSKENTYLIMTGNPKDGRVFITQCSGSGPLQLRQQELEIFGIDASGFNADAANPLFINR